jgi:peptidoglycan/xylan/chitin deacetylase (PgdA/CDA1 family)
MSTPADGGTLSVVDLLKWAKRGLSSHLFGPAVWRGKTDGRAIALTFDDGPSDSTPQILDILREYNAPATFFQCGCNVRRRPDIAREVVRAGHEIGNHSDTHPSFVSCSKAEVYEELSVAQSSIQAAAGRTPSLMRSPYGARGFRLRGAQVRLGLLNVMWTVTGCDWILPAQEVFTHVSAGASPGGIVCLHDGRRLLVKPDIRHTVEAVRRLMPALLERGYCFQTVSQITKGASLRDRISL